MLCSTIVAIALYAFSSIAEGRVQSRGYRCSHSGDQNCYSNGRNSDIQWCGQTFTNDTSGRIINGVESKSHEFPWMAKVLVDNFFFCGGSLIATNYVLTAGHCVASFDKSSSDLPLALRGNVKNYQIVSAERMKVNLGVLKFKDDNPQVVSQVLEIKLHPNYDVFVNHEYMMQTNDIAVLRIQPVTFTHNILPVCLPLQDSRVADGSLLTVAGWGLIEEVSEEHGRLGKNPVVLMKNTMKKISWQECRRNPLSGPFLDPVNDLTSARIICMVGVNTDACQGDSGGGVVQRTTQGFILQGVVSWGIGCNRKDFPSAYTRVSSYVNFVRQHTTDGHFLPMKPLGDNWRLLLGK